MNTIDIAPECLADMLPLLAVACRVVGSAEAPPGGVRLVIEIPGHRTPGHLVPFTDKTVEGLTTTVTVTFEPETPETAEGPEQ